jgi:hypothetical protein
VTSSGFGAVSATISGFAPGDVIDEPNIATSGFTVVTSGGNTVATLTGGTTPYAFTFAGTAISENLAEIPDATTGYEIVDEAACFARGTLIRAEAGEVLVEDLRAGDRVVTQDGRLEPVVWIGRRRLRPRLHPTPAHAHPIRVRAGAFGPEMPRRDLFVSPEHAIFTHDVLIPARCLVNGGSIAQAEVDEIVYYHIELARHDVVFAENLPAETWLDTGSRRAFDNAAVVDIHPVFDPGAAARAWRELAYAPLVEHGPMLARVRAGLAGRAAALGLAVSELRVDVTAPGPVTVAVPAGTSRVVIAAPAGRVAGGDARVLGCAIKGVHLDGTRLAPDDKRLAGGFHAVEGEGDDAWRWTDGAGALELGADATARVLDFTVIALAAVAREIAAAA